MAADRLCHGLGQREAKHHCLIPACQSGRESNRDTRKAPAQTSLLLLTLGSSPTRALAVFSGQPWPAGQGTMPWKAAQSLGASQPLLRQAGRSPCNALASRCSFAVSTKGCDLQPPSHPKGCRSTPARTLLGTHPQAQLRLLISS